MYNTKNIATTLYKIVSSLWKGGCFQNRIKYNTAKSKKK